MGSTVQTAKEAGHLDFLFEFFANYVRKVHSDDYIRKSMKGNSGVTFLDIIGPNDIAYVIALIKNGQEMWDQDIRIRAGGDQEKKIKPLFTSGDGKKRIVGKSLWNKEGKTYFWSVEEKWKQIYNSKEDMKILYNKWERWIESTGKDIKVGDGTKKTFHYVMGTWNDVETTGLKETNDNDDDDDDFLFGDGYSSDIPCSKHSRAWKKGQLRDDGDHDNNDDDRDNMVGDEEEKVNAKSDYNNNGEESSDDSSDDSSKESQTLLRVQAAEMSGSPKGNTRRLQVAEMSGSPAGNTRRGTREEQLLRVPAAKGKSGSPRKGTTAKRAQRRRNN